MAKDTDAPVAGEAPVGPRGLRRWLVAHLSVVAVVVPVAIGLIRLLIALPRPFLSGGDVAFIEMAVRRAFGAHELLGPYSRFGWHHPGPALFYLFAPIYALSGARSRALFVDAWLLNGACGVLAVVVIRHRLGEQSARVAAAVMAVLLALLGFQALINPWNPSLLCVPLVLLFVLSADAAAGSLWSLTDASLVGSFLIQTHLGLLPVVGADLAVAVAGWGFVVRQRRAGSESIRWRPVLVGGGLFAVMWAGPALQQATHDPGNLETIVAFFRNPPSGEVRSHSFRDSLAAVSNHATGRLIGEPIGEPSDRRLRPFRLALLGIVALGGAVLTVARRKHGRFLVFFGASSVVALVVGVIATTRVVGGLAPYLFTWTPAILVPGTVALAIATSQDVARFVPRIATASGVIALAAASILLTNRSIHADTTSYADSPDAAAAARLIQQVVGDNPQQVFRIRVVDGQFQTASMLLRLVLDGYHYIVDPPIGLYRGNTSREPSTGAPTIMVGTQASRPPPEATLLPATGSIALWVSNTRSG